MFGAHRVPVSNQHPVGQENAASSQEGLCLQLEQNRQQTEATDSWKKTGLNPGLRVCSGKRGACSFPPNPETSRQPDPSFFFNWLLHTACVILVP